MAPSMASQSARLAAIAATISGSFIVDQARLALSSPHVSTGPPASALDSHSRGAKYCVG